MLERQSLSPTSPAFDPIKAEWYQCLGDNLWALINNIYRIHESKESITNFAYLKRHIHEGSAIVYFNHLCLDDGHLIFSLLLSRLGRSLSVIGGPESKKHFDFRANPLDALVMRTAMILGIQLVPVVQNYDQANYSPEEALSLNRNFIRQAKHILGQPGGILCLAPEETRSKDGCLQQAQRGVALASRLGDVLVPLYFAPLAIIPQGQFRRGLNIKPNNPQAFELKMGAPFTLPYHRKDQDQQIISILMTNLANLLPPEMRGVWAT